MSKLGEVFLVHGFESPGFPCEGTDAGDDLAMRGAAVCRFSHDYVSVWESEAEQSWEPQVNLGEQDEISAPVPGQFAGPAAPSDFELAHGDEAAGWAAIGRRALLRRMDEE